MGMIIMLALASMIRDWQRSQTAATGATGATRAGSLEGVGDADLQEFQQ